MQPPPADPLHTGLAEHLLVRWPLSGGAELADELLAAYGDATRGYHDLQHLNEVLTRLDELAAHGVDYPRLPVVLAAWFHDAIYDGERDAEERSATWAESALPDLVGQATTVEVARLVRLTETHRPDDDDLAGCALSDADLAILAAPRARYDSYVAAVRHEYGHLDDATFRAGRSAVLAALDEKPSLFHTAWARTEWEAPARANLAREQAQLSASDVA